MATTFILERTAIGEIADFTSLPDFDPENKPIVDATFLRRLMLDLEPVQVCSAGVRIVGARIKGELDLSGFRGTQGCLPGLALERCDLPDQIDVSDTRLAQLSVSHSRFRVLKARNTHIEGNLTLQNAKPFPVESSEGATAYIDAVRIRIEGHLLGAGAHLVRPILLPEDAGYPGAALDIRDAKINGNVRLSTLGDARFCAEGSVWMSHAKIDGAVSFAGASIKAPSFAPEDEIFVSLLAVSAMIGSDFDCRADGNAFETDGFITLSGSHIAGSLIADGAKFRSQSGFALNADDTTIGRNASFAEYETDRFEASGGITFRNSRIAGNISFVGSRLQHSEGIALNLEHAVIGGSFTGCSASIDSAEVRLEIDGVITCAGIRVENDFAIHDAKLRSPTTALHLTCARIEGSFFLTGRAGSAAHRLEVEGKIVLVSITVGGRLNISNSDIMSDCQEDRNSVEIVGCDVNGTMNAFGNEIKGIVSLGASHFSRLGLGHSAWSGADGIVTDELTYDKIAIHGRLNVWREWRDLLRKNIWLNSIPVLPLTLPSSVFSPQPWRACAEALDRCGASTAARKIRIEAHRDANRYRGHAFGMLVTTFGGAAARRAEKEDSGDRASTDRLFVLCLLLWPVAKPYTLTKQFIVWLFAELPFGYGHSAIRALFACILTIFIGTAGVQIALQRGSLVEQIDGQNIVCQQTISPTLYALDTVIPLIDLGHHSLCMPGSPSATEFEPRFLSFEVPTSERPIKIEEARFWLWAKSIYSIIGALTIGFSVLIWTGVFQPRIRST